MCFRPAMHIMVRSDQYVQTVVLMSPQRLPQIRLEAPKERTARLLNGYVWAEEDMIVFTGGEWGK